MQKDGNNQFADQLHQDLDNGLAVEWAEIYALNALTDEERDSLERHVSAAPVDVRGRFQERVREAREIIAEAYGALEEEPPDSLLESINAQLAQRPAGATASGVRVSHDAGPVGPREARATGPDTEDDLSARRRHRETDKSSHTGRWLLGAAAAVVIVVGGVTVSQNMQPDSLTEQVITASDVQQRSIRIDGGSAELSVSPSQNAAVVAVHNMPALPQGKVYQLWRIPADGTAPVPAGTMTGAEVADGQSTTLEDIGPYSALAFTIEPEGGSTTPTMPIVGTIPLNA